MRFAPRDFHWLNARPAGWKAIDPRRSVEAACVHFLNWLIALVSIRPSGDILARAARARAVSSTLACIVRSAPSIARPSGVILVIAAFARVAASTRARSVRITCSIARPSGDMRASARRVTSSCARCSRQPSRQLLNPATRPRFAIALAPRRNFFPKFASSCIFATAARIIRPSGDIRLRAARRFSLAAFDSLACSVHALKALRTGRRTRLIVARRSFSRARKASTVFARHVPRAENSGRLAKRANTCCIFRRCRHALYQITNGWRRRSLAYDCLSFFPPRQHAHESMCERLAPMATNRSKMIREPPALESMVAPLPRVARKVSSSPSCSLM